MSDLDEACRLVAGSGGEAPAAGAPGVAVAAEWPHGAARPVRRDSAAAVPLDDNVALYDEVGQLLILLNTSAAAVWELCDGTRTLDEIGAHPRRGARGAEPTPT